MVDKNLVRGLANPNPVWPARALALKGTLPASTIISNDQGPFSAPLQIGSLLLHLGISLITHN